MATEVHWYKMNDNAASTVVVDSGSGASNGTFVNANTENQSVAGKINAGLTTEIVSPVADSKYIKTNTTMQSLFQGNFTFTGWVSLTDGQTGADQQNVFGIRDSASVGGNSLVQLVVGGGGNLFADTNVDGVNVDTNSADGTIADGATGFIFLTMTMNWSTGACKIYVNTAEVTYVAQGDHSTLNPANLDFTQGSVFLGARGNDDVPFRPLSGVLDDFRFFDGILTADQIALIYNSDNGTESSLADLENPPASAPPKGTLALLGVGL